MLNSTKIVVGVVVLFVHVYLITMLILLMYYSNLKFKKQVNIGNDIKAHLFIEHVTPSAGFLSEYPHGVIQNPSEKTPPTNSLQRCSYGENLKTLCNKNDTQVSQECGENVVQDYVLSHADDKSEQVQFDYEYQHDKNSSCSDTESSYQYSDLSRQARSGYTLTSFQPIHPEEQAYSESSEGNEHTNNVQEPNLEVNSFAINVNKLAASIQDVIIAGLCKSMRRSNLSPYNPVKEVVNVGENQVPKTKDIPTTSDKTDKTARIGKIKTQLGVVSNIGDISPTRIPKQEKIKTDPKLGMGGTSFRESEKTSTLHDSNLSSTEISHASHPSQEQVQSNNEYQAYNTARSFCATNPNPRFQSELTSFQTLSSVQQAYDENPESSICTTDVEEPNPEVGDFQAKLGVFRNIQSVVIEGLHKSMQRAIPSGKCVKEMASVEENVNQTLEAPRANNLVEAENSGVHKVVQVPDTKVENWLGDSPRTSLLEQGEIRIRSNMNTNTISSDIANNLTSFKTTDQHKKDNDEINGEMRHESVNIAGSNPENHKYPSNTSLQFAQQNLLDYGAVGVATGFAVPYEEDLVVLTNAERNVPQLMDLVNQKTLELNNIPKRLTFNFDTKNKQLVSYVATVDFNSENVDTCKLSQHRLHIVHLLHTLCNNILKSPDSGRNSDLHRLLSSMVETFTTMIDCRSYHFAGSNVYNISMYVCDSVHQKEHILTSLSQRIRATDSSQFDGDVVLTVSPDLKHLCFTPTEPLSHKSSSQLKKPPSSKQKHTLDRYDNTIHIRCANKKTCQQLGQFSIFPLSRPTQSLQDSVTDIGNAMFGHFLCAMMSSLHDVQSAINSTLFAPLDEELEEYLKKTYLETYDTLSTTEKFVFQHVASGQAMRDPLEQHKKMLNKLLALRADMEDLLELQSLFKIDVQSKESELAELEGVFVIIRGQLNTSAYIQACDGIQHRLKERVAQLIPTVNKDVEQTSPDAHHITVSTSTSSSKTAVTSQQKRNPPKPPQKPVKGTSGGYLTDDFHASEPPREILQHTVALQSPKQRSIVDVSTTV